MANDTIPFARPFIGGEEEEAVLRVLRSGWLTTGTEALAFEKEFSAFLSAGADDEDGPPLSCLAVNSATSGLHLALEACGLGPDDGAALPSYTFTSTAEVVRYLGAHPVFVDTAPGTFHIDPAALEKTLRREGKKIKAVIPVHFGGLPCDMEAITAIAKKYSLKVIEDAAHSFPSRMPGSGGKGAYAGTLGDAGVFSFYATKTITTGEGGMVASRNREMLERMAVMRSHGIDRPVWSRYTDKRASWRYEVIEPGFKYNLPDLLAAVGRAQLRRALTLLEMREAIAARYDEAFSGDERFAPPPTGPGDARHLYPLRLNLPQISISRDDCITALQDEGIGVSVHFIPLHTMPYYKKRYNLKAEDFPESIESFRRVVCLPIWPGMTEEQVRRVIAAVKKTAGGK